MGANKILRGLGYLANPDVLLVDLPHGDGCPVLMPSLCGRPLEFNRLGLSTLLHFISYNLGGNIPPVRGHMISVQKAFRVQASDFKKFFLRDLR